MPFDICMRCGFFRRGGGGSLHEKSLFPFFFLLFVFDVVMKNVGLLFALHGWSGVCSGRMLGVYFPRGGGDE